MPEWTPWDHLIGKGKVKVDKGFLKWKDWSGFCISNLEDFLRISRRADVKLYNPKPTVMVEVEPEHLNPRASVAKAVFLKQKLVYAFLWLPIESNVIPKLREAGFAQADVTLEDSELRYAFNNNIIPTIRLYAELNKGGRRK